MKHRYILLLMFLSTLIQAQNEYFQQEVNYEIDVRLDDINHALNANIKIEYTNNSKESLDIIYMHLWPNAYKHRMTAFGQQQIKNRTSDFYYADESERGFIDGLEFKVNGKEVQWKLDKDNPDIALLSLNEKLASGEQIIIQTPFHVKIPNSFSRLGHIGQTYQMTQWYPKPAVFDKDGWHPMPYLDLGEFYSEFGKFKVSINLPSNYVVGATGVLQEESERKFLESKIEESNQLLMDSAYIKEEIPSSAERKTISYVADKVHDFAWFADKQFYVQKDTAVLASGAVVDCWAMFGENNKDLWLEGAGYVKRAVQFYSKHVGEYPWPHATAVQSALSAGAGMEYPMITVIGNEGTAKSLDHVITHEVGHNWFYGILASNERLYPWLDEGINSYYDHRYTDQYYDNSSNFAIPQINNGEPIDEMRIGLLFQFHRHGDQAISCKSVDFNSLNYGLGAYEKPAVSLAILADYVGQDAFDETMKDYYQKWKFKHPGPADFENHWRQNTSSNLDWFFDGMIRSTKYVDYQIVEVKKAGSDLVLKIKNNEQLAAPFNIAAYKDGEIISEQKVEGFLGHRTVSLAGNDYDLLKIDPDDLLPEISEKNNTFDMVKDKKRPYGLKLQAVSEFIEHKEKNVLSYMPVIGFNNYDKMQLGLSFHNFSIYQKALQFAITPMFGFGSKELGGLAKFQYDIFPNSEKIKRIQFSLGGRSFNYNYNWDYGFRDRYSRAVFGARFDFGNRNISSEKNMYIQYKFVGVHQDYGVGVNFEMREFRREQRQYFINQLVFHSGNRSLISPSSLEVQVQQGAGFMRIDAELEKHFSYEQAKKGLDLRVFAGLMPYSDGDKLQIDPSFYLGGIQGFNIYQRDYTYEEILFGRNDRSGLWSQQLFKKDANFKSQTYAGINDQWMIAANLRSTLPGPIPLAPYVDLALYPGKSSVAFAYSAGVSFSLYKGVFEIFFPIIDSESIKGNVLYEQKDTYFKRITFLVDMNYLNPFEALDKIPYLW